jgi:hypothetical protein
MKNRDIDVFLGNRMSSQGGDRTHGALDFGQHSGRIGHRNVRLCDEFVSAERR